MKTYARAAALICVLGLIYGCTLNNGIQTPVFPPTLSPAPIRYTPPAAITVLPTGIKPATPIPPQFSTIAPTSGDPTRIVFPAGETFFQQGGEIPKGGSVSFFVTAAQEQLLMLDVSSPNQDVYLGVKGALDGAVMAASSAKLTTWQGIMTVTQDYEIILTAGGADSNFILGVTIPAVIKFTPGAISAAVQGSVRAWQNVHYMLYALAGQTMMVKVRSANSDILLTLYGINDGQPMNRSAAGATEWSGMLAKSQYYMIIAVSSGNPGQYLLDITIK